jgi:hypothetical protein
MAGSSRRFATCRRSASGISRHRHAEMIDGGRAAHVLQADRGWPRRTPSAQKQSRRRTDARSVCGRSFSAEGVGLGTMGKVGGRREQCRRHWDVGGYTKRPPYFCRVCGSVEHYTAVWWSKSKRSPTLASFDVAQLSLPSIQHWPPALTPCSSRTALHCFAVRSFAEKA